MKSVKSIVAMAMENQEEETTEIVSYDPAEHDAAVGAVEEGHREVEDAVAAIDTVEEVGTGIESLIVTLESLAAPLDSSSATFMNIAAESHLMRVGLDMSDSPLIATFENESETATRLSVDNLKTKLKAIWEAIKKAVMNAYQALMTFMKNAFDANVHLEKRAKALLGNAKHIGQAKARKETIEDGALVKKLHVAGSTEDLVGHFADMVYFIEGMNTAIAGEKTNEQIFAQTQATVYSAKSAEDVTRAFERLKQVKMQPTQAFPKSATGSKGAENHSKDLPGGVFFAMTVPAEKAMGDGLAHAKHVLESYSIEERQSEHKGELPATLPTLGPAAIQTICTGAIEIAERNKSLKTAAEEAEKSFLEISKAVEATKVEEGLPADQVSRISEFNRMIGKAQTNGMKRIGVILRYNTRCARDFIAYAEKSYAQYDVAKKEEATDQKPADAAATA